MIGPGIAEPIKPAAEGAVQEDDGSFAHGATGLRQERRGRSHQTEADPAAKALVFERLMLPHLNAAHNLARWLTGNQDDAQDVVQEAYLRAFKFFDGYNGGDGKLWLLTIVRNTFLTWHRREKQRMATEPFDEWTHVAGVQPADQESVLVRDGDAAILQKCIEILPTEFREVLVMRELEELSYRAIADAVGVPIGTVMSRLSRARRRLFECANECKVGQVK
jgi:RNA polymerase sigma-70 factor, ECF subfamily